jgi:DNA-binding transcriptional LysR family regulator
MESLRDIPTFIEVADAGSFSGASLRLNVTRSAVAKSIARLEQRLGARLFHRTTRSLSLTQDGALFHDRCLRALEEIRAGEAMLESGRTEIRGRMRISMPVVLGRKCVAPILTRLLSDNPGLELDLSFSDRIVDLLEDGIDLAIRSGVLRDDSDMMSRVVARQRMTVCAAPDYLERRGEPQTLDDLQHHDAILYSRNDRTLAWRFPTPSQPERSIIPKARLRLDDLEAIVDAAVAGMGLAWLPCWLIRDQVAAGRLVALMDSTPRMAFFCHAVWPKSPIMLPKTRLVIDRLAAELPLSMG